jgi:NAD-dependent SIR2 family protein deacetylase
MICIKLYHHHHICINFIDEKKTIFFKNFSLKRALVELQRRGILKCLVSQNCDGLHLRSGMNPNCLAELHGNMNLETCSKCGAKYLRDYDAAAGYLDHYTGRRCDKLECRGELKDSIINFGENLPTDELDKAFQHAQKADLCLVLGNIS